MKFTTEDFHCVKWMDNPANYMAGDTILKIMNAGKWNTFLELHQNDGEVDCDALYDYLRFEASDALLDVGLHYTEETATIDEILALWERREGRVVVRHVDGTVAGLQLYDYSCETCLEFESVGEDGEIEEISLDENEVADLLADGKPCSFNTGEWTSFDINDAVFEAFRGR